MIKILESLVDILGFRTLKKIPGASVIYYFSVLFCSSLVVLGLFLQTIEELSAGFLLIVTHPSILITDYMAVGGLGPTLVNAGLVGLIGCAVSLIGRFKISGLYLAAIFTLVGFGMFGKNVFNICPFILGVLMFSLIRKKPFKEFATPALFSTTLAPTVSYVVFGLGWHIGWGVLVGVGLGFMIPMIMKQIFQLHQGHNLYNIGTTGGFVGMIFNVFLRGFGYQTTAMFLWSTLYTPFLIGMTLVYCGIFIGLGYFLKAKWSQYKDLLTKNGLLPSDFVDLVGFAPVLINMGIVGLIGLTYLLLIGAPINGAVMAGIFTMIGFSALGKHPKNIIPIILGVYLISLPKIWHPTDPGVILAALFSTTLAPICGRFGFFAGLIAGVMHLPMVMFTGTIHGFFNLYNNGFAAGFVALIFVGVLKEFHPEWFTEKEKQLSRPYPAPFSNNLPINNSDQKSA